MSSTKSYYNLNSSKYANESNIVDFSRLYERLHTYTNKAHTILDIGCGSGRDASFFAKQGKIITAIDYSDNMIKEAIKLNGYDNIKYITSDITSYKTSQSFDLIWANASLLHLDRSSLGDVLLKIATMMSDNGCFYASYKECVTDDISAEDSNGRFFAYYTADMLKDIYMQNNLRVCEVFITNDSVGRSTKWINVIASRCIE